MTTVGGRGRLTLFVILLLVLVFAGAALSSRPEADAVEPSPGLTGAASMTPPSRTDEPGRTIEPELSEQIRAMRGDADAELVFHEHDNGAVSVDVGNRFLQMSVATVDAEGNVRTSCVSHEQDCTHPSTSGER